MDAPQLDLTCAEAEQLLPLVADGALDVASDPALFAHLARCAICQESLACYDLVGLAIGAAPQTSAPARLSVIHFRLPWSVASAAAALVAALFGAVLWWQAAAPSDGGPTVVDREVIEVQAPGGDGTRRLYLIRSGDRIEIVDPARLDGGRAVDGDSQALPAGHHRY